MMSRILFYPFLMIPLIAGLVALKGFALYRAARRGETVWFIILLVFQTLGILELIYLFIIADGCCSSRSHHHHEDCDCNEQSK